MPHSQDPWYDTSQFSNEQLIADPHRPGADVAFVELLVVYAHPLDMPDGYVIRRWYVLQDEPPKLLSGRGYGFRGPTGLTKARVWIQQWFPNMTRSARSPGDDPTIVEVYL